MTNTNINRHYNVLSQLIERIVEGNNGWHDYDQWCELLGHPLYDAMSKFYDKSSTLLSDDEDVWVHIANILDAPPRPDDNDNDDFPAALAATD